MKNRVAFICIGVLFYLGCVPKIVVLDKQTILEQEAAGEWPNFETDLLTQSTRIDPTPFPKTAVSEKKKRLYQVLNGELVSGE